MQHKSIRKSSGQCELDLLVTLTTQCLCLPVGFVDGLAQRAEADHSVWRLAARAEHRPRSTCFMSYVNYVRFVFCPSSHSVISCAAPVFLHIHIYIILIRFAVGLAERDGRVCPG